MNFETFESSVQTEEAPEQSLGLAVQALWWDAKGDWEKAHDLCQQAGSREGDWVHAYLHRVEGDEGNASYWYSRSGHTFFDGSLKDEWKSISRTLLGERT